MKSRSIWILILCFAQFGRLEAQQKLSVAGNGLFLSPASTNVDILNTDDNTNALIRFGDNGTSKVSVGFNGNEDLFKISTATTLGADDFTMGLTGLIGINSLPGAHRLLINHNSTSGTDGSAHLMLQENNTADFTRLRFGNLGNDGLWTIAARATAGDALLNFFYNDGTNFANIMSLDGNNFRVGIHQTTPEGYLHVKQVAPGINAIVLENDDATGGEKWGIQIGNTNLDYLFEGVIRGSFSSATGAYTAFPPPAAFVNGQDIDQQEVLSQILQLRPVQINKSKSKGKLTTLDPAQVAQVNPDWVVRSEDGQHLGINYQQFVALAIRSVQEQQELIDAQEKLIAQLEAEEQAIDDQIATLRAQLAALNTSEMQPVVLPSDSGLESLRPNSQLKQNVPNPFGESTQIELNIPESALQAELHLTNQQGVMVRKYRLSKGTQQLNISAKELDNGIYYYSLIVDGELVETRQMIIRH